ncbi:MAG: MFS transporter [Asticcacaulis sp.]
MSDATTPTRFTTAYKQSLFYVLMYAGTGATLPFMPLWFKGHGMSPAQIGAILALPLLLRAVSGPISGLWADSFRLYRTPAIILSFCAACFFALLGLGSRFPAVQFPVYLLMYGLAFSCVSNLAPMIDAMTLHFARKEGFVYALPRAAGSMSFIFTNVGLGFLLLLWPVDTVLIWVVGAAVLTSLGARFLLPAQPRPVAEPSQNLAHDKGFSRLKVLMRDSGFVWLLIAVGCLYSSHTFYYAFSTIIWKAHGLSSSTCGYLWATGVLAEVAFMWWGEGLRRKAGPWRMLMAGGVFAVVRWSLMTLSPPLWALYLLQVLHALSFAATYLAGLELVHLIVPKGYESLGQTVNAAYANGLLMGMGTLASGAVYGLLEARGYGLMALISAAGLGSAIWLYRHRARWLI